MEQTNYKIYIGIDVSKTKLDIKYDDSSSLLTINNQINDFKKLNHYLLKDKTSVLVLLEGLKPRKPFTLIFHQSSR